MLCLVNKLVHVKLELFPETLTTFLVLFVILMQNHNKITTFLSPDLFARPTLVSVVLP